MRTNVSRRRLLVALLVVAAPIALIPIFPAAAQPVPRVGYAAALVVPDRVDDTPSLKPDLDKFAEVDNFAWRAFVALNWPADPAHRGQPDRAKALADPGARVWETFKSRYELFQVGPDGRPLPSSPWASNDAVNPCGSEVGAQEKTLASFEPFMDFNQFNSREGASNPLVAQNRTYTRYETRLNELQYTALSAWSQGNLPDEEHPAELPAGAIAVKAAWRPLTAADTPAVRARYYVVENANIVDAAKTVAAGHVVCSKSDIALVGLHVVIRTTSRPQGIWATFEHIDNVPRNGITEPDAQDVGMPYSYFDPSKPKRLGPKLGLPSTLPVSLDRPPKRNPTPMQVVRVHPIHAATMAMSRYYWSLPGVAGTVWANYMLVAAQWPSHVLPVDPRNDGVFYPFSRNENLANTTIETYVQDRPMSCMTCHRIFNQRGRNFLGLLGSFR